MTYDPRPLYEQNTIQPSPAIDQKPKPKMWAGINRATTHSISPLIAWALEEKRKQKAGLENDHDIAEIKAAAKGVKNRWYHAVNIKHPAEFKKLLEIKKFDWQKLIELNCYPAL